MGRYSTGAIETDSACRIEMSYLLKNGFLQKGKTISWRMSWTGGSNISITGSNTPAGKYIRLQYTLTEREGTAHEYDYKIMITSVPSNLGKGEVLYFICPVSGKRCRILYKAYGYHKWKSREAYQNRLYYPGQRSSKLERHPVRYFIIQNSKRYKELLSKMYGKHSKLTYKGKPTAWVQEFERMEEKMEEAKMKSSPIFQMYF